MHVIWLCCPAGLQQCIASQPHAEVHYKFFRKQLHSAVLHFYLHPRTVTSSRQASGIRGGQSWPHSLYASWLLLPGTRFGGRCDIYMFLVCLIPDLSLVVCSCSMGFQGISGWRQHLQSLVAFSEKVKPGMFDSWLCRCAIQVTDKLFNWCEVSIATNSVDEEWLVLEDFPALLLPMTTEWWGWITAC